MSKARYNEIDPSQYEIKMLYDDTYLYVAFWSDDRRIESSPTRQIDVDQESDGLTSLVIELPERARTPDRKEIRLSTFWHSLDLWGSEIDALRKAAGRPPNPDHFRDVDHDGKPEELHFQSGPPRAPYALDNDQWGIQWAPSPLEPGEWNNAAAVGKGYAFEYRIPLRALGWPEPGEPLRANVVLADHDGNPQGRYNDFKTRYASFWWGTDKRELWEYDGKGKPMKPLPIPASKERAIALAPSDLAGSLPGRPGTVLSHFDEARGLESDRPMRFIAGYAGKAARIQGPATITVPCSGLDAAVVLQFLARCDAPAKMSIAAEDASGNRTLLGERLLDPADLRDRPERWHRVALPVGALGKNASKIRKVRVMIESGDAALDEMSALDAEDVLSNTLDFLAGQQLASSGLVRSFVGTQPAHTYDQAVALLAFTEGGRETEARRLAKAMVGLQEKTADQGFFYDSYSALDSRVGQGTDSGVGPNAWMALALARYGSKYHDLDALKAADRVCRWLLAKRSIWVHEAGARRKKSKADEWTRGEASLVDPQTGAVWAAITHDAEEGAPTRPDIHGHDHDRMLFWYSTEGVIDAEQLFDFMNSLGYDYRTIADKMREWMFRGGENSGWNRLGRFNVGHNDFTGNDERLYLDCQTWGAILAQMHGDEGKATLALETARQMISTRSFQGTTIRGFNDSRYPENDSIWFGGTAHYVAACSYLKDRAAADPYVATLLETQRISGGWPHSSDAAYTTCFVRKSDGKVVLGYVDEATGIAYDDPAHLGEEPHRFDPKKYPEPEWTGYGSYHNAKESVGETAWVYFALKGFWSGQPLPYPPAVDRKAASK
ncbi:MAG: hypothetical protein JO317_09275 [Verrucomicrobiae bacterium]|nr:hypothetical protein [Verrucomicrobiae bacterium]